MRLIPTPPAPLRCSGTSLWRETELARRQRGAAAYLIRGVTDPTPTSDGSATWCRASRLGPWPYRSSTDCPKRWWLRRTVQADDVPILKGLPQREQLIQLALREDPLRAEVEYRDLAGPLLLQFSPASSAQPHHSDLHAVF